MQPPIPQTSNSDPSLPQVMNLPPGTMIIIPQGQNANFVNSAGTVVAFVDGNGNIQIAAASIFKIGANQILSARKTGWVASTTPFSRADMGATPTVQTVANTLSALITDLLNHGLIGA